MTEDMQRLLKDLEYQSLMGADYAARERRNLHKLLRALRVALQDLQSISNIFPDLDGKKCGNLARATLNEIELILKGESE